MEGSRNSDMFNGVQTVHTGISIVLIVVLPQIRKATNLVPVLTY
jgi:hypothetical protein